MPAASIPVYRRATGEHSEPASSTAERTNSRPQRLHTWLNLIPLAEYERERPARILFLDTFVTVTPAGDTPRVLFEGRQEMTVVVYIGVIFVWYGADLLAPDRPFPVLYEQTYPTRYITSRPTVFDNTHVMDFVENGSDNLHFKVVHRWKHSRLYDHVVTPERITLKQDTRFNYGSCSLNPMIRLLSRVIPELELTHDYVYHGPCLAVVNATGRGAPPFHALVSLTPEGSNRTRVYVTMALSPETFPAWMERAYQRLFPRSHLCDLLCGVMANYIKNEFDVDAIVWRNRRWLPEPRLITSERHLYDVIRWGETFYPPGFEYPPTPVRTDAHKRWHYLGQRGSLSGDRPTAYTVAGTDVVAFLDRGEGVRVFSAYCPHQGAHLGYEAGGRIERDCLRCPFHGFHFDSDGRCLGQNPGSRNTCLPGLDLPSIPHRIRDGAVEVFL